MEERNEVPLLRNVLERLGYENLGDFEAQIFNLR